MSLSLRPVLTAALLVAAAGHARAQCDAPDRITPSDPVANGSFGSEAALDSQYILVGAPYRATAAGAEAGSVYGYLPNGAGGWNEVAHLVAPDGVPGGHFGGTLGLGGNAQWAVVGAWGVNSGAGEAYIIHRTANTWSLANIFTPNYGPSTRFGQAVAMNKDGTLAAVAAPYADVIDVFGTTPSAGRVLVYGRNANDTWTFQTDLHQFDISLRHTNDFYGLSLGADGNSVIVGVPGGDSAAHTDCGFVHIWSRDAQNNWTGVGEIYAPDAENGAMFGQSVAMSGDEVAVGAPYATGSGVQEAGKVYLFRNVNGAWVADGQVTTPNPAFLSAFGSKVALSGDLLIVGSNIGVNTVYEYRRISAGQWVPNSTFVNPATPDITYGTNMAIDGHRVVICDDSYTNAGLTDSGCVYTHDNPFLGCDSCEGATAVSAGGYGGCTTNATVDGSSSCGEALPTGPDVWFSYTAYATGSVTFTTQGSSFDTILSIHSGCPGTAANSIACNDDFAAPQRWSQITLTVAAGSTYLIRVAGYGGASGYFVLGISGVTGCYANCDGSTTAPVLNVNDFICFQSKFAANDPWANCDQSTQPPILNVNDFICFQTKFAAGCP
jgi:hypothetical protein